jgi:branched-subunit amino acid aminotransferase/4-amino-4-deoxychorismate lyase
MSMADRDGLIWLDGEMVPWREAKTHVLTHTLHYGLGCFEGVRAYNTANGPAIFRLQEHTDRLFRSAHILNMKMPFTKDDVNEAQRAAVRENNLDEAYLRPMVFLGEISYEIFLIHLITMELVMVEIVRYPIYTGSVWWLFVGTMVVTIPLAWLLHRFTRVRADGVARFSLS